MTYMYLLSKRIDEDEIITKIEQLKMSYSWIEKHTDFTHWCYYNLGLCYFIIHFPLVVKWKFLEYLVLVRYNIYQTTAHHRQVNISETNISLIYSTYKCRAFCVSGVLVLSLWRCSRPNMHQKLFPQRLSVIWNSRLWCTI